MTLKPIVASMFLLGLASSSAFAATSDADTQVQLDAMKAKIAKMEAVVQQNQTGGFQQTNDWFNRISFSGLANIDLAGANRSPLTMADGGTYDLSLSSAVLLMDANVSEWTKAHVALSFEDQAAFDRRNFYSYDAYVTDHGAFVRIDSTKSSKHLTLDEAYVTLGNLAKSPFYARIGRQYVNFGDYQRYPITASLTQLLTQTRATAATVGFVDASGFYGSAYAFRGLPKTGDKFAAEGRARIQNFGANLGFAGASNNVGYKFDAGLIRNMADVDVISDLVQDSYVDAVAGLSLHASVNSGPFDASVNYVTALKEFNANDAVTVEGEAAKPSAWGIEAGYSFATMGHQSRVALGYQGSKRVTGSYNTQVVSDPGIHISGNLYALPTQRYIADYTVNVSKYTDLGVQVYNDRGYGLTGKDNATVGVVRLGVKFA